jgi:hypothetical protein
VRLPLWVQRPCPWWLHHWIRGRARVAVQCVCCVFCCVFPAAHYSLSGPVATRSFRFGSGSGGGSGGGSSGSPALLHRGSLGAASNPNPLMKVPTTKKSWPESTFLSIIFSRTPLIMVAACAPNPLLSRPVPFDPVSSLSSPLPPS